MFFTTIAMVLFFEVKKLSLSASNSKDMNRFYIPVLMLLAVAASSCTAKVQTTDCVNPLTYTDIPDNDLIRVGEDYYMVSTTMYFCPGAPIMHSKDLVHWRIVNYVYDCLADDDVYNLREGNNAYGKGQWAASLRYHEGTYYTLFIANDQRKTFIYKTDDIENGKWEQTVIDRPFHDASLLFEDGRVFLVWGNGDLRITELKPDLSGVLEGGVDQLLISSPREGIMLRAEGAHFYHIGDYYYVLEIDWPMGGVRTETCWRSKSLLGEYESKTVLQGAFDGRGDGVAQGGIIETQNGDWYAIMFQDHGAVGRIPTLQPVTWVDGWPILGDNTVPVKQFSVNLPPCGDDYVWDNDEFDSGKNELALVWQWNHKPDNDFWSLTECPGSLRLTCGHLAAGVMDARNTLTQRTVGPACCSEVLLDASGLQKGDHAGLCAFQSNYCRIGVTVADDGSKHLEAVSRVPQRGRINDIRLLCQDEQVALDLPLEQDKVWLRLSYVFTPENPEQEADVVCMSYSLNGGDWTDVPLLYKMRYTLDFFTGYRSALYCYPTQQTGGHADFDYFHNILM